MKSILKAIRDYVQSLFIGPFANAAITLQSHRQRQRTRGQKSVIHFEAPYEGQGILLLALYQKGGLRPDILRLLDAARAQGLYILGVNTLKVADPKSLEGVMDCYIERPNFGRDFGSYKSGFMHVYDRGWDKSCPRLLMVNDSIYYATPGLKPFLDAMFGTSCEVLGATENHQRAYHLGSFCISMSGATLRAAAVRAYWNKYKLTDVRPRVIKTGEYGLSKVLRASVSGPEHFTALYSYARCIDALEESDELLDFIIAETPIETPAGLPARNPDELAEAVEERFLVPKHTHREEVRLNVASELAELASASAVTSFEALLKHLARNLDVPGDLDALARITRDTVISMATEPLKMGSQIHLAEPLLLKMGLPIIKLDGLYRGTWSTYQVIRMGRLLPSGESAELTRLLTARPYGGDTLKGVQKVAFERGLI